MGNTSGNINTTETLHITLSYFSGLPDPAWNITSSDEQYNNIMNLLDEAASRHMLGRPREMPSRLGYKGFLVRRNTTTHWVFGPGNVELQKVLLSTAPEDKVSSELRETLTEDIDTSSNSSEILHITVVMFSGLPDPSWNITSSHKQYSNIMNLMKEAESANLLSDPNQIPARLGYKGFFVRGNRTTHWIFGPETVELQKALSSTAPDNDDDGLKSLREKISENINFYFPSGTSG